MTDAFRFVDESDTSEDDIDYIAIAAKKETETVKVVKKITRVIGYRPFSQYILINSEKYNYKTWRECFPDNHVCLRSLIINPAWDEFFIQVQDKPYYKNIEKKLSEILEKNPDTVILPYAELVFNIFNILSPAKIKLIIMAQDPYPKRRKIGKQLVPDATGSSFSNPLNHPKAISLKNIYKNLLDFKHIQSIPESGSLMPWILQGCFMINAAFTTLENQMNIHKNLWREFTIDLIHYISQKHSRIVYMAWGAEAHVIMQQIDPKTNCIITTSHPSGQSCYSTLTGYQYGIKIGKKTIKNCIYPSFESTDHFGIANRYLQAQGKKKILWDLL